jgi:hypothetical protein
MGWLARIVASSAALTIVGCAAIANLGDGTATADDQADANAGSSGATSGKLPGSSSGTPGADGGSSGTTGDGGSTAEASVDGASACTKTPNGGGCTAAATCCSNVCTTDRKCNDQCRTNGACNPFSNSECCIGAYCSVNAGAQCTSCRANGTAAEVDPTPLGNVVVRSSCCSGNVDNGTKNCIP